MYKIEMARNVKYFRISSCECKSLKKYYYLNHNI